MGEDLPEPGEDPGETGPEDAHDSVVLLEVGQADLSHTAEQELQLALIPE